jgi:O-antigen chain-terminating methyltransferase
LTEVPQIIDVERLVKELRERVAARRREGDYTEDLTLVPLPVVTPSVALRPHVATASSRPLVGRVRWFLLRLLWPVLDDLARQTDAAVRRARADAADEGSRLGAKLTQEVRDRSTAADERLARLELRLAELEAGEEGSRLPRGPLEYKAFEDRFRPEDQVQERQRIYRDTLAGRTRVVDLGCGRGELLELLRDLDVPAYGVDVDAGFVEQARVKGLEVVQQEAVTHLRSLEPGAVDTIVSSHLIEHLAATTLFELIELAAEKVGEGGLVIFETPNPTSLFAGSVNFHRDPTHVHPIHPDTLVFLCERAGFTAIEVWPLVPVPADVRLPERAPGEGELAAHVDAVVGQLNELLYGHQDYALLARR